MGASAPPRKPPKFWIAPSEPTRFGGAAAVASAHELADAALARKITTEMHTIASVLLCTSAAGIVNATMPSIAMTTELRRLATGLALRLVMRSENQPAVSEPRKPQKNGTDAATPVCIRLM